MYKTSKLELKNISKDFESTKVLDDINISVCEGEFIVLVGPSGSGKSTILRIIAGLEEPTTGEIKLNGKTINNLLPKDRDIAMVFQNYALYPHLSVYENIAFPLKMRNVKKELIETAVNEASELLGIKKYLTKKPKELSGGERQRVALGRAIVRKPQLFLMDEPLSNLDAKLRTQMRSELLKLHKMLSSTVVYVTHDQIEALTMGNKIVVLNKGLVQQIGTPDEIYNNPSNMFVAGFIGNPGMNFFDFKITNNSKAIFAGEEKELSFDDRFMRFFKEKNLMNKDLALGIRPEHISLKNGCPNEISLNASVDLLEMLGNEYLIYATLSNQHKKVSFSVKSFGENNFNQNGKVTFSIDLNKAHFFDIITGSRIIS